MSDLFACLLRLAQLQRQSIDTLALKEAVSSAESEVKTGNAQRAAKTKVRMVMEALGLSAPGWSDKPDLADMPCLLYLSERGWLVLRGKDARGNWIIETFKHEIGSWQEESMRNLDKLMSAKVNFVYPYAVRRSPVLALVFNEIFQHKWIIFEMFLASVMINGLTIASSLYSQQIYNRVVPTGASQTLLVLTLGVALAAIFELLSKQARSNLQHHIVDVLDKNLARHVLLRFLSIRLDQMPRSVGSLAGQLRGYESIRTFLTSASIILIVDAPFAVAFLLLIMVIGGGVVFLPLFFLVASIALGILFYSRMENLANQINTSSNLKMGLLVETVEGAETIKSGQAGWRMLSRWIGLTNEARHHELSMRNVSESAMHFTALFQQLSYVGIIAVGALSISKGTISVGDLIACSILSGRVLAPMAAIPGHLVQWSSTKAALRSLDQLWLLGTDHEDEGNPIVPAHIIGKFDFNNVVAQYGNSKALAVNKFSISGGDRVGVLGPVGAGKTTLLRLLSGMYKPLSGMVLLDNVDIAQISKPVLAENVGYLQQEGRLFAGTLRENLILGMLDPGDEAILETARLTGLYEAVVAVHPKGLDREIFEGGVGLSGGQRQLVNLTRLFLRKPRVWLLDEPTASMDDDLQQRIISAIANTLRPQDTLVVVTHKPALLQLVNRLVVVMQHGIAMDGPKSAVLDALTSNNTKPKT